MMNKPKLSRRIFLISSGVVFSSIFLKNKLFPQSLIDSSLQYFDEEVEKFINERRIPGASLAVFNQGKIVYARGYGYANIDDKIKVTPTTMFRIASLSKPLTAVGVLTLFERNKVDLDSPAIEYLKNLISDIDKKILDKRWYNVTVRRLLHHTGGWDSKISGDPMFFPASKIEKVIHRQPGKPIDVIEYMLSNPLDFEPGTRYAYSNFGYCILGRIIEAASGNSYEEFIKKNVLEPIGIKNVHSGFTEYSRRFPNEAVYYTAFNNPEMKEFPEKENANPYGSFRLELMDSHGGWVASAVEYARFCLGLSEQSRFKILKPQTYQTMIEPPAYIKKENAPEAYYGCGWLVRPQGNGGRANLWHTGSLPGTYSFAAILGDGRGWVALFNGRSADEKNLPNSAIDRALHRAASKVKKFPNRDLWTDFYKS